MTIKEFIEAAIEGGWREGQNPKWDEKYGPILSWTAEKDKESGQLGHGMTLLDQGLVLLDPEAWKAVGKVKKWNESEDNSNESHCGACGYYCSGVPESKIRMEGMVGALYEDGKTLEEYIATL